jgi:hypothetical protein
MVCLNTQSCPSCLHEVIRTMHEKPRITCVGIQPIVLNVGVSVCHMNQRVYMPTHAWKTAKFFFATKILKQLYACITWRHACVFTHVCAQATCLHLKRMHTSKAKIIATHLQYNARNREFIHMYEYNHPNKDPYTCVRRQARSVCMCIQPRYAHCDERFVVDKTLMYGVP